MKILLQEMSTTELADALEGCDTILLPVGSIEQHGAHLPLFTDSHIAFEISKRTAESLSEDFPVLVAPLVPFGSSVEHRGYPGTISLRPSTFLELIEDVCRDLAGMGFRKIVLVNGHGGNTGYLGSHVFEIADDTNTFLAVFDWLLTGLGRELKDNYLETGPDVHAGELETSILMATWPEGVNEDKITEALPRKFSEEKGFRHLVLDDPDVAGFSWFSDEVSEKGVIGDPTKATEAKGEAIIEEIVERLGNVLREIEEMDV